MQVSDSTTQAPLHADEPRAQQVLRAGATHMTVIESRKELLLMSLEIPCGCTYALLFLISFLVDSAWHPGPGQRGF